MASYTLEHRYELSDPVVVGDLRVAFVEQVQYTKGGRGIGAWISGSRKVVAMVSRDERGIKAEDLNGEEEDLNEWFPKVKGLRQLVDTWRNTGA